jgi:hypothetical protein
MFAQYRYLPGCIALFDFHLRSSHFFPLDFEKFLTEFIYSKKQGGIFHECGFYSLLKDRNFDAIAVHSSIA